MFSYRTPGVYFERLDRLRPITGVRTDIAGFVGIARRGPLHTAVKLESWQQFFSVFGGISQSTPSYLGYAVRGFFDNGGRECYVVRVADPQQAQPSIFSVCAVADPADKHPTVLWGLEASSPGTWGTELRVIMRRTGGDRINLTVWLPQGDGEVRQTWTNLPLNDLDALRQRIEEAEMDVQWQGADEQAARQQKEERRRMERLVNFVSDPAAPTLLDLQEGLGGCLLVGNWVSAKGAFAGGNSGLDTLTVTHFSGVTNLPQQKWGLAVLADVDEISILAMPDMMPYPHDEPQIVSQPIPCDLQDPNEGFPNVPPLPAEYAPGFDEGEIRTLQMALIQQCEIKLDRFAILDTPPSRRFPEAVMSWRDQFDTSRAALYFPWVRVQSPRGEVVDVPVCGHVAGIYARGDTEIGVHKPPANMPMEDVKDVTVAIDDVLHGVYNERQINVLRVYPGRGIRIGGAVTLSSDTLLRYINVRRLLLWIEESIDESTQIAVFEPNNQELWRDIERIARGFMDAIWRAGMLDGATAEQAYLVRCDETTNPPEDTDRGLIQCEIKLLPPHPAEYVLVRIGKVDGGTGLEITERRTDRRS